MTEDEDPWPSSISTITENPPIAILRQQGLILGKRTQNRVYGEVWGRAVQAGKKIELFFDIVAPLIGYQAPILKATYDPANSYPVEFVNTELTKSGSNFEPFTVTNEENCKSQLARFFQNAKVLGLIKGLIAQSISPVDEDEQE
jgi:hypothetical protein